MATSQEIYEKAKKDNEAAALKKYNELSAVNSQSVNDYIKQLSAATDASTKLTTDSINKTISGVPQQYQKSYDTNAIQQLINERQVAERMANMGLTDSGLNRTQQTAINVQRSNSDAALSQQQNSAVNTLKQQISDYVAQTEASKLKTTSEAKYNLAQQNNTLKQNLLSSADENAIDYTNSWITEQNNLASQALAAQKAAVATTSASSTDASKQFEANIMTNAELARRGNKTSVNGKTVQFSDYSQYVRSMLEKYYNDGQLKESEVAYLKGLYNLD